MLIVLQRVAHASVSVDQEIIGSIQRGYVLLLGVMQGDTEAEADFLVQKVLNVRLFEGEDGKINDRSIQDIKGELLVVSQFTLAGRLEKGNRPDYTAAEKPDRAQTLYTYAIDRLKASGLSVAAGCFGAHMQVDLTNEGPVTLLLERDALPTAA